MKHDQKKFQSIDEYVATFSKDIQTVLQLIRRTIREAAPQAVETMSYQIPTFKLQGNLVHFAAWKKHIGFYPGSSGIRKFKRDLSAYEGAKGSVQFPLDKPMPLGLIKKIVKFRTKENEAKAAAKRARK